MKNQIFTFAALSLCLLTVPSWAMDEDADISLNRAGRLARQGAAPAATVEDADDSSSSSSSDSELNTDLSEDKKSKQFFVYIANPSAGGLYKHIASEHNFSVTNWKREQTQRNWDLSAVEKFFRKSKGVQQLCRTMKRALKKFDATQTCKEVMVNGEEKGMLVTLATREEQSAKVVAKYCRSSEYVYKVFADEGDLNRYLAELSTASSTSTYSSSSQAHQLAQMMAIISGFRAGMDHDMSPRRDSDSE